MHPITAYQIPTDYYNSYYKTRAIGRSSTSRQNNMAQVEISRPAIALATDTTIPQNEAGVNSELSTDEAQSTSNPDATDGLGAADAGFAQSEYNDWVNNTNH